MKEQKILIFLIFLMLTVACFNSNNQRVIASVNEKDLLLSEVIKEMPEFTKDSSFFIDSYIKIWARKQLMIYHAEINLSSGLTDYEKQIQEYRESLLIYAYQQELINQNFDTTITSQDILEYYNRYREEFKLVKNIFIGRYITVDKSAPSLKDLSKWYKSDNEESAEKLVDYCQQFAKEYYLTDSSWQYFSNINDRLPNLISEEEYFLQHTKGVWFEDEIYRYYIFLTPAPQKLWIGSKHSSIFSNKGIKLIEIKINSNKHQLENNSINSGIKKELV